MLLTDNAVVDGCGSCSTRNAAHPANKAPGFALLATPGNQLCARCGLLYGSSLKVVAGAGIGRIPVHWACAGGAHCTYWSSGVRHRRPSSSGFQGSQRKPIKLPETKDAFLLVLSLKISIEIEYGLSGP